MHSSVSVTIPEIPGFSTICPLKAASAANSQDHLPNRHHRSQDLGSLNCADRSRALWGRVGKQLCFLTCSFPFSLATVAILACQLTLHSSHSLQPRPVDSHTWQPVLGKSLWGTGEALLVPKQSSSLCLYLAQRKAVLPQTMLWGSLWTQR